MLKATTWIVQDPEDSKFNSYTREDLQALLGEQLDPLYTAPLQQKSYADDSFDSRVQWPNCVHPIRD